VTTSVAASTPARSFPIVTTETAKRSGHRLRGSRSRRPARSPGACPRRRRWWLRGSRPPGPRRRCGCHRARPAPRAALPTRRVHPPPSARPGRAMATVRHLVARPERRCGQMRQGIRPRPMTIEDSGRTV
jgi:hypothetical protein